MTKAFVPMIALLLGFLTLALFGATKAGTDEELFDITPKAAPYIHEIEGNVAVTFVHDFDTKKFHFGAVATLLDGTTLGNWDNSSKPAPKDVPALAHAEGSQADLAITTINFHKLPLAKVRSVKVIVFSDGDDIPLMSVQLPSYFGAPPAAPAPLTLTLGKKEGHFSVSTSAGLTIDAGGGSYNSKISSGGVVLEAQVPNATVTDSHGDLLMKAGHIDVLADAKPAATAPASKK